MDAGGDILQSDRIMQRKILAQDSYWRFNIINSKYRHKDNTPREKEIPRGLVGVISQSYHL